MLIRADLGCKSSPAASAIGVPLRDAARPTAEHLARRSIRRGPDRNEGGAAMSADYTKDIAKYTDTCDEACVAGIVRHCGIALQSRDASMVSCSDESERARVRDSFLKKKLGRTEPDAELDAAILEVCDRMKDTRQKSRVTFYYLLAQKYDQLDMFRAAKA
jgi:hypothetical protein